MSRCDPHAETPRPASWMRQANMLPKESFWSHWRNKRLGSDQEPLATIGTKIEVAGSFGCLPLMTSQMSPVAQIIRDSLGSYWGRRNIVKPKFR